MKHWVFSLLCLAGFIVAAFFTVTNLYHGAQPASVYREDNVIDTNRTDFPKTDLYPEESSPLLFGEESFKHVYPKLAKVFSSDEVFLNPDASFGWVFRSSGRYTDISLIAWTDTDKRSSKWYRLYGSSFATMSDQLSETPGLRTPILRTPGEESIKMVTDISFDDTGIQESLEKEPEIIFGKDAFKNIFPGRTEVSGVKDFSVIPSSLSRGWIVRDSAFTEVARVYWDDNSYWQSDWKHLEHDQYIKNGVFLKRDKGWDGNYGSNKGVIIGILFAEAFFFLFMFLFFEAINAESWNKSWNR